MPELRRKTVLAELNPAPTQPFVEVRVGQRLLAVTVESADISPDAIEVTVTRSTLRLRSKAEPRRVDVFVSLPVTSEPGRYWVRFNHGVCDVVIARSERSV